MKIIGKRIRSIDRHLSMVPIDSEVVIGLPANEIQGATLAALGFSNPPAIGETVMPDIAIGPVSRFNAEGKFVPDRTQQMEWVQRTVWRRWTDWHGNEHDGYAVIDYQRYPRIFHAPPEIYLSAVSTTRNETLITAESVLYHPENYPILKHRINLFLEVFGKCEVFSEGLERIIRAPLRRLDWVILPKGHTPWPGLIKNIGPIIQRAPVGQQPIVESRFQAINHHNPAFYAMGRGGFSGYLVFGFPTRGLYLMESIFSGNATYVFGENWERISRLTKAEIITNSLQVRRVVHRDGWATEIRALLDQQTI